MSDAKSIYNYRGYAYEFETSCIGLIGTLVITSDGPIGKIAKIGPVWKIARRNGDGKSRYGYDSKRQAAEAVIDEHIASGALYV